jgi:glycosyltransferase involved in cell wall biosynthesis
MPNPWLSVHAAGDWLLAIARSLYPDVVHLNGYSHATLAWPAPVVVVAHSCVRSWWSAVKHEAAPAECGQYTDAVKAGLEAAAAIVAPTAAMLSSLATEYGTLGTRAHVIPNGCPPLAQWAEAQSDEPKQPIVLTAGRAWDEAKNIAAVEAIAHRLTWPVVVAGATTSPAGESAAFDGVHVLGEIPASEMRQWYDRASIYVLPARYEPFGLSVLEAARAGCALVVGDIESLRENWHGAALFVSPDDPPALGVAIQSLIDDPIRRCRLAAAARARAGVLSIDRTANDYLELYRSVLA